jgi:uncharacterized protein YegL
MPKLMTDTMDTGIQLSGAAGSSFQFSAVKIENLGSTEYTLVTIAVDISGSISGYEKEIESCLRAAIEACSKSPRAENLLLRVIRFDDKVEEVHGFILLNAVDFADYVIQARGMTALFQATYESLASTLHYAESLVDQDFNVNGIMFVITDGMDNRSKETPTTIAQLKDAASRGEKIESMLTVLIGINVPDPTTAAYLATFERDAKFDQFVDAGTATKETLAKLAAFVSKSISSQSQSLGTGGASQTLVF